MILYIYIYIYKVYLKNNETGDTNNLFQFRQTTCFPFKLILSSLMHFPSLLYHASIHSWKDSSEMSLNSIITTHLKAFTPLKWLPLIIPLSFGKRKSQNAKLVVLVRWYFSRPGTARCSTHPVLLLSRHTQIFGVNLPNTVLFHIQLICNHSNNQLMIVTHLTLPYPLDIYHYLACWMAPTPELIFHFFMTLRIFCPTQKHMCAT